MLNKIQQDFLSVFSGSIEISNLREIIEPNEKENIYFLAGVSDTTKRNTDHTMLEKNYFFLDFDLRNWFRDNEKSEVSDEEIIQIGEDLARYLTENSKYGFNQWRYIVFTGNGLHLYYVGKSLKVPENISPREYAGAMTQIHNAFQEFIGVEYFKPDPACKNIGRVARLPDTINQKNGKKAFIVAEQHVEAVIIEKLPFYGKRQVEMENEYQELLAKKYVLLAREEMLKGENRTFLEAILAYPVEALLMESGKIEIGNFVKNKNFVDPRDKSYYGFYKAQDGNYIVVGGSTTLSPYADGKDGLNPFHLVQGLYGLDNAGVYNFFKTKLGKL